MIDPEISRQITEIERDRRVFAKARMYQEQGRRKMRPGRLMDFVTRVNRVNNPKFHKPNHLRPLIRRIELSLLGTVETCVSIPVRMGKTTTIVAAIVWILLRNPRASILYVSYAHGFAKKQVRAARDLARMVGIKRGDVWKQDNWTTAEGGYVKASGMSGQLTGEGFTHIFVDDPHKNRAEAESYRKREGVVEGFWSDVYTRRVPTGTSVFIVHARWHVNDLIGVVGQTSFESFTLPALLADGSSLAPYLFSREFLEQTRDKVGPYVWASLYQGNPTPRTGSLFKDILAVPEKVLEEEVRKAPAKVTCIGVDFARTARTRSDHHAAAVVVKHPKGPDAFVYDIVDAVEMQGTLTDHLDESGGVVDPGFVRELARMARAHPDARWAWYGGTSEEWLAQLVEGALNKILTHGDPGARRVRIRLLPIENRDKWLRAQGYAKAWNDARVRVSSPEKGTPKQEHMDSLVAEHVEFTGAAGNKDNFIDAVVAAFDDLEPLRPGAKIPPRRTTAPLSEAENIGRLV